MLKTKADTRQGPAAILSPDPGNTASLAAPKVGIEVSITESMDWKPMPVEATVRPEGPTKSWPPCQTSFRLQRRPAREDQAPKERLRCWRFCVN